MDTVLTQSVIGADGGALVDHAIMPPHEPHGFTSTTHAGSIGISFTGHRRAVRRYSGGPTVEADILPVQASSPVPAICSGSRWASRRNLWKSTHPPS